MYFRALSHFRQRSIPAWLVLTQLGQCQTCSTLKVLHKSVVAPPGWVLACRRACTMTSICGPDDVACCHQGQLAACPWTWQGLQPQMLVTPVAGAHLARRPIDNATSWALLRPHEPFRPFISTITSFSFFSLCLSSPFFIPGFPSFFPILINQDRPPKKCH